MRAIIKRFSVERIGLLKVPRRSKPVVTIPEAIYEPGQRGSSHGVAGWAKFQCFTIKVDRLVDVTAPPSVVKLGNERFCA